LGYRKAGLNHFLDAYINMVHGHRQ